MIRVLNKYGEEKDRSAFKFSSLKYARLILISFSFISFFLYPGCQDRSLFTELGYNRLEVMIKGTFESNGPVRGWNWGSLDPNVASDGIQDDSVIYYSTAADVKPTIFMVDIAELRLNNTKFANYRQVFSANLDDSSSFFNGDGVKLKNDDPVHGASYSFVKIFFRKLLFDNAKKYKLGASGWELSEDYIDMFHEKKVLGFNFNKYQVLSHFDTLRLESSKINRVFPLYVPIIGGFKYNKHDEKTVLEIRFIVKNFIKKYEYEYFENGVNYAIHYYAFSDWFMDIKPDETDLGGNLLAVARVYVPDRVGSIEGTNFLGAGYIIAIPSGDPITDYSIPQFLRGDNDNTGPDTNTNCDIPFFQTRDISKIAYIEELLDYYLKYEKYKYEWNHHIESPSSCNTQEIFEDVWSTYNTELENFKIPPFAVWNSGTSAYSIENVPAGTYAIYFIPATSYGKLYYDSDVSAIQATVTVSEKTVSGNIDMH